MNRRGRLLAGVSMRGMLVPGVLVGTVGLVVFTAWWGRRLTEANPEMVGRGSPWYGHWDVPTITATQWYRLVPALLVGAALLRWWPAYCRRAPLRRLPPVAGLVGVIWAVAVQAVAGWRSISTGVDYEADYLEAVPRVGSPQQFLETFVARADTYPVHVQGHPPGQVLLLWALDRVGLGGPWAATAQTLLFAALATAGVLTVVRWHAGEQATRRSAVFIGLTPAVLTTATSTDPTFSALAVLTVLAAFATARASKKVAVALGAVTGLLAAVVCFFTYAAPLFVTPALVPLAELLRARRRLPIVAAALSGAVVTAGVAASGFWWWDGFQHTRLAYASGIASERPYRFFVIANLAVALVALGPAVLAAATRRPLPRVAPLIGCAAVSLLFADLSGLSKGEVERIWLPFLPWLALTASALPDHPAGDRRWLLAQLSVALGLQLSFVGPW